jgi:4-amino-4-deoxy-L-arabinose transferase-like glycosyltransferase
VSAPPVPLLGHRERALRVLVLLFAAGLFTFRLGAGSLWDLDEPRYAQISREILATGDPVTMHLGGRPWFGRPPLWMWLVAAAGRLFGFSEWTARAWAAAFGTLGVAAVTALGREWFGPRTGILSGLVLATMLEYLLLSRLAILDVVQTALMLLALHAFYRGYRDRSRPDYLRAFLYAGLATLAGGPVAPALLLLVLVPFLAYRRALRRWREIPWGWGGAIYLGIAAPWYVVEGIRAGPAFWRAAIGNPAALVFPQAIGGHAATALYHAPVLILGAVPWTAFLPGAVAYHYRRRWQDGSLLCLLWCAVAFAAAVALGHRLPDEVFPIYPLAAIAIARLWEEFLFEGGSVLRRTLATSFVLQIGVVIFLIVAAVAFATARYPTEWAAVRGALVPPLGTLVLGTAATAALFRFRRYTGAFLALPATMALFTGVLYTVTVPVVETQKPVPPLARLVRRELRPGDRIIGYLVGMPASLVYYTNHPVDWVTDPATLVRDLCAPGRVFLVTTREALGAARASGSDAQRARLPEGVRRLAARGTMVLEMKPETLTCGGDA